MGNVAGPCLFKKSVLKKQVIFQPNTEGRVRVIEQVGYSVGQGVVQAERTSVEGP